MELFAGQASELRLQRPSCWAMNMKRETREPTRKQACVECHVLRRTLRFAPHLATIGLSSSRSVLIAQASTAIRVGHTHPLKIVTYRGPP